MSARLLLLTLVLLILAACNLDTQAPTATQAPVVTLDRTFKHRSAVGFYAHRCWWR
jgi:outer membrane biogenesis lipoprotein LolB